MTPIEVMKKFPINCPVSVNGHYGYVVGYGSGLGSVGFDSSGSRLFIRVRLVYIAEPTNLALSFDAQNIKEYHPYACEPL